MSSLIKDAMYSSLLAPYMPLFKMAGLATQVIVFLVFFILSIVLLAGSSKSKQGGLITISVFIFLMTLALPAVKILLPRNLLFIFMVVYILFSMIAMIIASSNEKKLEDDKKKGTVNAKRSSTGIFILSLLVVIPLVLIFTVFKGSPTEYVVSTII
uniref:Uncharacterized protein n=1 Tax=viral metagenome TaxID=1070528 RepID=A0A6C0HET4_9ZZZZ